MQLYPLDASRVVHSLTESLDYTRSFRCDSKQKFTISGNNTSNQSDPTVAAVDMRLTFSHMQAEAFEFNTSPYDVGESGLESCKVLIAKDHSVT